MFVDPLSGILSFYRQFLKNLEGSAKFFVTKKGVALSEQRPYLTI